MNNLHLSERIHASQTYGYRLLIRKLKKPQKKRIYIFCTNSYDINLRAKTMLQIRIHIYLVLLDLYPHMKIRIRIQKPRYWQNFSHFFTQIHRLFKIKIVGPFLNKYRYDLLTDSTSITYIKILPICLRKKLMKFYFHCSSKAWIRIRTEVNCWIRIC